MGEKTGISWTDKTWNPWHGCLKVSPGCKFCYMYRDKERYGQDPHVVLRSKSCFNDPLKWKSGRVFTCSWSDFFIEQADAWRDDAWDVIRRTPHLTYQILTKRPERIAEHLPKDWGEGWPHVWLGTSVENQDSAIQRIPRLLALRCGVRFLSIEPQLEPINLKRIDYRWQLREVHKKFLMYEGHSDQDAEKQAAKNVPDGDLAEGNPFLDVLTGEWFDGWDGGMDGTKVDWVICGGESGPGARPFDIRWAESLLRECREAGVAFFLKQLGSRPNSGGIPAKVTKAGADPMEWPEYLRVQEFPGERESL